MDCNSFLNWMENRYYSFHEKAIVFQSLVITLKSQPALDDSLEAQAVKFLKSVHFQNESSADTFLSSLATFPGDSSTAFVHQIVPTAAMEMLSHLLLDCSQKKLLSLVKADLIPQLVMTLNSLPLLFTEAVNIRVNLTQIVSRAIVLATPDFLEHLGIVDNDEQQAVRETKRTSTSTSFEQFLTSFGQQTLLPEQFGFSLASLPPSMVATLSFSFAATLALLADSTGKHQKRGSVRCRKSGERALRMRRSEKARLDENEGRRKGKWVDGGQGGWMFVREGRRVRRRLERGRGRESEVDDSPPAHLSACVRSERRSLVSLCVTLDDDTAPAHQLSPHSSPNKAPVALEGMTRLLLTDLSGSGTSEHCGVEADRQNIDTADLATYHVVSAVAGIPADTHHIVSFAHCMDGWMGAVW
ncbi:hypothetical protein BLNAU_8074 [Blattamonas nauphoetae]|uniref:Uncharacterized protein n=1 Tax=Blattamonas nauphoetae TaxID=2049346 RepID=A0ABQ9XZV8_9EUKA|nr:hypothetical protein BLNAU_8074 [Blattamonas nauphoetae]